MSSQMAGNEARRQDVTAIEERVSELEKARRQESVDGFVHLLAPEALWVTGGQNKMLVTGDLPHRIWTGVAALETPRRDIDLQNITGGERFDPSYRSS